MRSFRFSIDRGGTFTDVYAEIKSKDFVDYRVIKLLSEDPSNYRDAPTEGIRRVLEEVTGIPHPREKPLDTSRIEYIRMGTTVATNALLERRGTSTALIASKGFQDVLLIGNQTRPKIFELNIHTPEQLYDAVMEVDERIQLLRFQDENETEEKGEIAVGVTGERIRILQAPDMEKVQVGLQSILNQGITSIAVVFMHSYLFPLHEKMIGDLAKKMGFQQISLSSEVIPMVKIVPRGLTCCVDAYLTPVIKKYVASFKEGFDEGFSQVQVSFMQSDGGLTPIDQFMGHKAILSGPAGGVVGYSKTAFSKENKKQAVIGFDMGGTSTDASRFDGRFEHVYETTTAGVPIQAPQLDINTIAAGGGSRLFFRNGIFVVGPESSGAHPGPVAYRKGGYLSVTDANLVLGRVLPDYFHKIFGPKENEPLDLLGAQQAMEKLRQEINGFMTAQGMNEYSLDQVAYGFIRVANESMCRPIRNLTQMRGLDIKSHALACFGGAGPQHACAIAKSLGMKTIYVHRFSGILSAYGLSLADIVVEKQNPSGMEYKSKNMESIENTLKELSVEVQKELRDQGFQDDEITIERFLNMRYEGTDCAIMTPGLNLAGGYDESFTTHYRREFGFVLQDREILVDDVRIRGTGASRQRERIALNLPESQGCPKPQHIASVYFEGGRMSTPVYNLENLARFDEIQGPAIIMQNVATVVIEPGCVARITFQGDIEIAVGKEEEEKKNGNDLDPIMLSLFSHRFMGIAEQMGKTLQRTSISVNIKERLDFSCALFGPDGGLVANAPHLPVHLGAMQEAVRFQIKYWKEDLHPGDVLLSNHPQLAGGSHLPDITVMTPVFHKDKIVFFVGSRGHHADIGGISPGSMPPFSKSLEEEGAAIVAFKLVTGSNGHFNEAGITELLLAPGKLPNNSGTRNLKDNISDLKAQIAANTRGVSLMLALIEEYSLEVVQAYMIYIQENSEQAVKNMLEEFSLAQGLPEIGSVFAEDFMDNGTRIFLEITINRKEKTAIFDFTGTGLEVYGNINAPPAVTYSSVIYCLRCLLGGTEVPLNQGCLNPVTLIIPQGSILNPSPKAAIVGGNVLTSQRVTDVIFRAFQVCAASQGCMNNLTFGDSSMGYYETIGGGTGAGPGWNGCSGIQSHMTNTRITDPEILELRFPVLLCQFSIRKDSGGNGAFHGGDGIRREILFLRPLDVSILSERRSFPPYGMAGGSPGKRGENILIRKNGKAINLGGKNTVKVETMDRILILTPGGGGYGKLSEKPIVPLKNGSKESNLVRYSGSLNQYSLNQESA